MSWKNGELVCRWRKMQTNAFMDHFKWKSFRVWLHILLLNAEQNEKKKKLNLSNNLSAFYRHFDEQIQFARPLFRLQFIIQQFIRSFLWHFSITIIYLHERCFFPCCHCDETRIQIYSNTEFYETDNKWPEKPHLQSNQGRSALVLFIFNSLFFHNYYF